MNSVTVVLCTRSTQARSCCTNECDSEAYMANQVASEVIEIIEDDNSVGEECWDLLEVHVAIYSSNFLVVVW